MKTITTAQAVDESGRHLCSSDCVRLRANGAECSEESVDRDQLTGLPNRSMFEEELESAISFATSGEGKSVAVLFIDLDRFKVINNVFGRAGGNEVLQQVAQRLSAYLKRKDLLARQSLESSFATVARSSGDEFTMMLTDIEGSDDLSLIAQGVIDVLSIPFHLNGEEAYLTASVGIALSPDDGLDSELLLRNAEMAMFEAKQHGGGLFRMFNASMKQKSKVGQRIDSELRKALKNGELQLHYQPIVDPVGRSVVGAEALLRWDNPVLGRVGPDVFIPVAEETGVMIPIGAWVLREACRQLRAWIDEGMTPIRMAVNVSLCQLHRDDLVGAVRSALEEADLDPSLLELELSERGVLRGDPKTLAQLRKLKELGVRLSVDDFGTGNSAIAYLRKFPLDVLKIDRSYIRNVEDSEDDRAIVSAIAAMAQRLNLEIIVEGVETEQQLELVREWSCDLYQGFLFSPAVEADEFRRFLV